MKTSRQPSGSPWTGNWEARILSRIREHGHESVASFLAAHPGTPYLELAELLSRGDADVAAVQLERLHVTSAGGTEKATDRDLLDSLCRSVRAGLRRGWEGRRGWDSDLAGSLADWIVMWGSQAWQRGVLPALIKLRPPKAWSPVGPEDEILKKALSAARDSTKTGN